MRAGRGRGEVGARSVRGRCEVGARSGREQGVAKGRGRAWKEKETFMKCSLPEEGGAPLRPWGGRTQKRRRPPRGWAALLIPTVGPAQRGGDAEEHAVEPVVHVLKREGGPRQQVREHAEQAAEQAAAVERAEPRQREE